MPVRKNHLQSLVGQTPASPAAHLHSEVPHPLPPTRSPSPTYPAAHSFSTAGAWGGGWVHPHGEKIQKVPRGGGACRLPVSPKSAIHASETRSISPNFPSRDERASPGERRGRGIGLRDRRQRRRRARAGVRVPGRLPGGQRGRPRRAAARLRLRLRSRTAPAPAPAPARQAPGGDPAPQRRPPPAPRPPKFLGHVLAPRAAPGGQVHQGRRGRARGLLGAGTGPAVGDASRGGCARAWGTERPGRDPPGLGAAHQQVPWARGCPAPPSGSLSDAQGTRMLRRIGKGGRDPRPNFLLLKHS